MVRGLLRRLRLMVMTQELELAGRREGRRKRRKRRRKKNQVHSSLFVINVSVVFVDNV